MPSLLLSTLPLHLNPSTSSPYPSSPLGLSNTTLISQTFPPLSSLYMSQPPPCHSPSCLTKRLYDTSLHSVHPNHSSFLHRAILVPSVSSTGESTMLMHASLSLTSRQDAGKRIRASSERHVIELNLDQFKNELRNEAKQEAGNRRDFKSLHTHQPSESTSYPGDSKLVERGADSSFGKSDSEYDNQERDLYDGAYGDGGDDGGGSDGGRGKGGGGGGGGNGGSNNNNDDNNNGDDNNGDDNNGDDNNDDDNNNNDDGDDSNKISQPTPSHLRRLIFSAVGLTAVGSVASFLSQREQYKNYVITHGSSVTDPQSSSSTSQSLDNKSESAITASESWPKFVGMLRLMTRAVSGGEGAKLVHTMSGGTESGKEAPSVEAVKEVKNTLARPDESSGEPSRTMFSLLNSGSKSPKEYETSSTSPSASGGARTPGSLEQTESAKRRDPGLDLKSSPELEPPDRDLRQEEAVREAERRQASQRLSERDKSGSKAAAVPSPSLPPASQAPSLTAQVKKDMLAGRGASTPSDDSSARRSVLLAVALLGGSWAWDHGDDIWANGKAFFRNAGGLGGKAKEGRAKEDGNRMEGKREGGEKEGGGKEEGKKEGGKKEGGKKEEGGESKQIARKKAQKEGSNNGQSKRAASRRGESLNAKKGGDNTVGEFNQTNDADNQSAVLSQLSSSLLDQAQDESWVMDPDVLIEKGQKWILDPSSGTALDFMPSPACPHAMERSRGDIGEEGAKYPPSLTVADSNHPMETHQPSLASAAPKALVDSPAEDWIQTPLDLLALGSESKVDPNPDLAINEPFEEGRTRAYFDNYKNKKNDDNDNIDFNESGQKSNYGNKITKQNDYEKTESQGIQTTVPYTRPSVEMTDRQGTKDVEEVMVNEVKETKGEPQNLQSDEGNISVSKAHSRKKRNVINPQKTVPTTPEKTVNRILPASPPLSPSGGKKARLKGRQGAQMKPPIGVHLLAKEEGLGKGKGGEGEEKLDIAPSGVVD